MNSYYEKGDIESALKLSPCADIFVPEKNIENIDLKVSFAIEQPLVRPKQKPAVQNTDKAQSVCAQTTVHQSSNTSLQPPLEQQMDHQTRIIDIMQRQNDITAMLVQQNQKSVLPPRNIPVFDEDSLQYKSFRK